MPAENPPKPLYRYEFTDKSTKQFEKLAPEIQDRILEKLDQFCADNPLERAERLIDFTAGHYRFRIGDWRVIFDLEENTIVIHKVGHRRDVYNR